MDPLTSDEIPPRIPLGEYIFRRLNEIGISHVFGVPGDFNLNLLDQLYSVPSMKWVGTCNELNAAYAADGYARIRGIPGALITTYGVGELSAINGIAGAYSEHVPILHIVGTTSRLSRQARIMIHHTLGENIDHDVYQTMSVPVRCASAFMLDDATFTQDVDLVIEKCMKMRKPAYLYIPMDTPDILVDSSPLSKLLDIEIRNDGKEVEEAEIIKSIWTMLEASKRPIILADVLAHRYGAVQDVRSLVEKCDIPVFVTPLGKGLVIDETDSHYGGLYNGQLSINLAVRNTVEYSDALIHIGPFPSDSNTGGWTQKLDPRHVIHLGWDRILVTGKRWEGIHFVPVLKRLLQKISAERLKLPSSFPNLNGAASVISFPHSDIPLDQHNIWRRFSSFIQPNDCVIAEVGTAQCGTLEFQLPSGCVYFTQLYYSCIGFTVGALLGALVARREQDKENEGRAILFVGDGSLQLTAQEFSTIIRNGFTPTIVLINNSGYTVERVIHGPSRSYNNIATWDYQKMLSFFGGKEDRAYSYSARTYGELSAVIEDPHFARSSNIQLLEVHLDKFDAPWTMTAQVNIMQKAGGFQMTEWDRQCQRDRKTMDTSLWLSEDRLPVDGQRVNEANKTVIHRGFSIG